MVMEAVLHNRGMILGSKMKYEQRRGRFSSQQSIMLSDMVSDAYRVPWIWKKCAKVSAEAWLGSGLGDHRGKTRPDLCFQFHEKMRMPMTELN